MVANKADELLRLKKRVEELKLIQSREQGKLESLKTELKQQWGCDSLEQAKTKIQRLKNKRERLENRAIELLEELDRKLGGLK
jgi:DNA anti-recombination protein RmuC